MQANSRRRTPSTTEERDGRRRNRWSSGQSSGCPHSQSISRSSWSKSDSNHRSTIPLRLCLQAAARNETARPQSSGLNSLTCRRPGSASRESPTPRSGTEPAKNVSGWCTTRRVISTMRRGSPRRRHSCCRRSPGWNCCR